MLAEALLERETLDREEVYLLAAGKPLPEFKRPTRAADEPEAIPAGASVGGEGLPALMPPPTPATAASRAAGDPARG